jgi:small-conductance mechanosensitive channel
MVLALIKFAAGQYKARLTTEADQERLDPVITAARRFVGFMVLIVALSIALSHFGIDMNTLFIVLIITGIVISMAGNAVVSDALSGFIILVDQPFRVGDSIYIQDLDTWGDVLKIGERTTRIVTKDNRELIVPNSTMAKSPILNYTYPDTKYRLQTDIELAYGNDIEAIRKTATKAVRSVKDVLDDEPVNVYFLAFDASKRKMRVRWWIASFHNEYPVLDEVNAALEEAFAKAHIDLPSGTYDVNIQRAKGDGQESVPDSDAAQEGQQDEQAG